MSEWERGCYVSSELQEALIRNGKLLFFLQERATDDVHVCIDLRDGSLYVAVIKKRPYCDTRDFNAPDFSAASYDWLPSLIVRALRDPRGREAAKYTGMTAENWKDFINK